MHTGDGHIVHQCLSGNTEAFALLVDKYKARIFALVYAKVGQFEDAEDITQEVFLHAYKKLSTLRRWDQFYPWIYSIAANRCKNFHRDKKRRIDTVSLADPSENHRADMEAHAEKLKNEQLHDALATLPEMYRQVLVLRYMAGMKSKEIAQTLRVSPNTINQRLMRAREKLKTVLNEEMIPMMPNAFADRKLHTGFTSRVVELIQDTKIQTPPHKTPLPWGLSAVGGLIILLLSLSIPHSPLYPIGEWIGSPLPLRTQVAENGELPVDAEVTQVALLADTQGDGDFGQKPKPLQTPAAIGEGEETDEKEIAITGIHIPDNFISTGVDISPDGTKMVYANRQLIPSELGLEFKLLVLSLVDVSTNVSPEPTVLLQEPHHHKVNYFNPKWSPDGKWVAFYRLEEVEGRRRSAGVYLIPAAGGEMRFLAQTGPRTYAAGLSWAPDSRALAFVRWIGENTDIYVVSLDTDKVRPLTTDGKMNTEPSWSPDGKWLFYLSQRYSPKQTSNSKYLGTPVWKQPVDGDKAVPINAVSRHPFIHSPDGRWIAYTNIAFTALSPNAPADLFPDRKGGVVVARVNEQGELVGEPILLKASINERTKPVRWTPDGKLIVLQQDYRDMTYALNVKNGTQRRVGIEPEFSFKDAQWLFNGNRLFLPYGKEQRPGVFDLETGQFTPLPIELPEGMRFGESTLSSDKKWVAYVLIHSTEIQIQEPAGSLEVGRTHIMPVRGGASKQVMHGELNTRNPRWSPDGQKIAFINVKIGTSRSPESHLCVGSVSDGQVKTLDSGLCMMPTWSPDGTMLAYLRLKPKRQIFNPDTMEATLYIVQATGGKSKRIANIPEPKPEMQISWTSDGKWITFEIDGATWVVSTNGGAPKKLQKGYIPSSWGSDGASYLAFGPNGKLERVSLDGATSPILASERPVQVQFSTNARALSTSPDGETILFQQIESGTQCWRIDVSHLVGQ